MIHMELLSPNDLKEKFNTPWIAPYQKVITLVDDGLVELIEYHPCPSGSHWMIYQYQNSSELILTANRDGNKHTYISKIGKAPLELKASFNAAGIEEISVNDNEVKVVHAGLAGAGVGAAMCRGMAEGVKRVELYETGGGSKLGKAAVITPIMEKVVIGVDDTDTKDEGATWTMAHNLGLKLANEGFEYLDHIIVQLYPHNPHKTQNCVSVALSFAIMPGQRDELINRTIEILKEDSLSDKTSIAILDGIMIPEELREYSIRTKQNMMSIEEAEKIAEKLGIELISVTGSHGKIGALAALGLYDDCEEAVKVYHDN